MALRRGTQKNSLKQIESYTFFYNLEIGENVTFLMCEGVFEAFRRNAMQNHSEIIPKSHF